jgi:hypothetical protein
VAEIKQILNSRFQIPKSETNPFEILNVKFEIDEEI